ncbi:MAG: LacI family DNA-binding transcriptional regulator [Eubacteriales bacterium]
MRITIDEIARLAGVSKTTVSRVLNNKPDVKPETRELILNFISKYGYQPNAFAQAISLQKSQTVGLIIPYNADYIFSNPFYSEVIRGVSTETTRRGYHLLLCYTHEENYVGIYKQRRVEGFIIISPGSIHKEIIRKLSQIGAPFVTTSQISGEDGLNYVDIDNFYGAGLAIEHLISLGHQKIGFICGQEYLTSSKDRMSGYVSALKKYNLPFQDSLVKRGDGSIESGYQKMFELIDQDVTAVFVYCDIMAMGAVKAIKEKNLKIPYDISVVGFDDIPLAQIIEPPLTTIKQPAYEKGESAASMLIDLVEGKEAVGNKILPVDIVVRKSTGKLSFRQP